MEVTLDFKKHVDGLVPAIVQDHQTLDVLMLGYMNEAAWKKTQEERRVTFYSRSKGRLWTKGEESGNFLDVIDVQVDCDQDTVLIQVNPYGPVCHTGTDSCFGNQKGAELAFINHLDSVIEQRRIAEDPDNSYVASLFKAGIGKIAQKVGEEAVELALESKDGTSEDFLNEAADLLFHYMVLLKARNLNISAVSRVLRQRHEQ